MFTVLRVLAFISSIIMFEMYSIFRFLLSPHILPAFLHDRLVLDFMLSLMIRNLNNSFEMLINAVFTLHHNSTSVSLEMLAESEGAEYDICNR